MRGGAEDELVTFVLALQRRIVWIGARPMVDSTREVN
jgi:hypothetical protein